MRQFIATETSRPGRSPMELDVGRVQPKEALALAGVTVLSLFTATLGALVSWIVLPRGPFQDWPGWRLVFLLFGLAIVALGISLAITLIQLTYDDWISYRRRLDQWHRATLAAYLSAGGKEVERTATLTDLSPSLPLHMLAVALSAHRRVAQGAPTAFSVRELTGPVFVGGVRLGDLSPSGAELASKQLAQIGLIKGRAPKKAGEWAAESEGDVINAIVTNWHKISNKPETA